MARAVARRPSGALQLEPLDDTIDREKPEEPGTARAWPDGPYYVRGEVEIVDETGRSVGRSARLPLCRCEASRNKHFCDNSHRLVGFTAR